MPTPTPPLAPASLTCLVCLCAWCCFCAALIFLLFFVLAFLAKRRQASDCTVMIGLRASPRTVLSPKFGFDCTAWQSVCPRRLQWRQWQNQTTNPYEVESTRCSTHSFIVRLSFPFLSRAHYVHAAYIKGSSPLIFFLSSLPSHHPSLLYPLYTICIFPFLLAHSLNHSSPFLSSPVISLPPFRQSLIGYRTLTD